VSITPIKDDGSHMIWRLTAKPGERIITVLMGKNASKTRSEEERMK